MSEEPKAKHTPGWRAQSYEDSYGITTWEVVDSEERNICDVSRIDSEANAALIARAVNCHDDLLAACKGLMGCGGLASEAYDAARAAIDKAEGRET